MLCLIKCIWIYLRCKITPIEFDHKWENRNIVLVMKKKSYAPHWPFLLKPQERGSLKKLIYLSSHFLWLQRVGMFSEIAHFSHLWNPYTPVGAGYLPQTFQTAEHGTTLRLPLLKYLCLSSINCLYAAFLNCRILLSKGSFLVSALLKIQGCKMSGSRQSLWNLCVKVTQSFFFFFCSIPSLQILAFACSAHTCITQELEALVALAFLGQAVCLVLDIGWEGCPEPLVFLKGLGPVNQRSLKSQLLLRQSVVLLKSRVHFSWGLHWFHHLGPTAFEWSQGSQCLLKELLPVLAQISHLSFVPSALHEERKYNSKFKSC